MTEPILRSSDHQEFLARIAEQQASTWQWSPGIEFVCRQKSIGWRLALRIQRQAQRPGLLGETLQRRFENGDAYEGCNIVLDSQHTFVVWHPLPGDRRREQVLGVLARLLSLVGLKERKNA